MSAVGLGSFAFHARPCFVTQLLDEVPMCVLTQCYLLTLLNLHPSLKTGTTPTLLMATSGMVIVTAFAIYVIFEAFEIFLHLFTFQIVTVLAVSFDLLRKEGGGGGGGGGGEGLCDEHCVYYYGKGCLGGEWGGERSELE